MHVPENNPRLIPFTITSIGGHEEAIGFDVVELDRPGPEHRGFLMQCPRCSQRFYSFAPRIEDQFAGEIELQEAKHDLMVLILHRLNCTEKRS